MLPALCAADVWLDGRRVEPGPARVDALIALELLLDGEDVLDALLVAEHVSGRCRYAFPIPITILTRS